MSSPSSSIPSKKLSFSSLIIPCVLLHFQPLPIRKMPPVELDSISHVVTEFVHTVKEDILEPIFTRSKAKETDAPLLDPIVDDVEVPSAPVVTSEDLSVPTIAEPPSEMEMVVSGFIDEVASYTLVRTALKTVDYALDICEKVVKVNVPPATKYVQKLRRYLRVVRHAGRRHARARGGNVDNKKTRALRDLPSRRKKAMREASITGYFADFFQVNFLLHFLGLELTCDSGAPAKHKPDGHETDDEESTVYKLMKEYDSQDDDDYVPSDSSEDSMEYESDSENETTQDKLNKHYEEKDDEDYVPSGEESKESIEYNSEAEVSDDAEESQDAEDSQEKVVSQEAVEIKDAVEEVAEADSQEEVAEADSQEETCDETEARKDSTSSVESTTVDKLMEDCDDDLSQEDPDYVPEEKSEEDSCEYNSDEEAIKEDKPVEVDEEVSQDSDAHLEVSQDDDSQEDSQEMEEEIVTGLKKALDSSQESKEDPQEVEEEVVISQVSTKALDSSQESKEDSQEVEEEVVISQGSKRALDSSQESKDDTEEEIVVVDGADIES